MSLNLRLLLFSDYQVTNIIYVIAILVGACALLISFAIQQGILPGSGIRYRDHFFLSFISN